MNIGLTYDLKEDVQLTGEVPDDALEEYDSPGTVEGIGQALAAQGHEVHLLGGGRRFLQHIQQIKPDLVFNISEGLGHTRSREAQVPSILEMLDIPYTGADPQTLSICLDKALTKTLISQKGIKTPRWTILQGENDLKILDDQAFQFPVIIKPVHDGSSKGVRFNSLVEERVDLDTRVTALLMDYNQPVLLEEYIEGDEITVGVLGNDPPRVFGIMRIRPKWAQQKFIYSLEVKRDWEKRVVYQCPALYGPEVIAAIETAALSAYSTLGCRDFGRVDFRLAKDGTPYFIEINPLAGLNPDSSDLPIMAALLGISYSDLIAEILHAATGRYSKWAKI